MARPRELLHEVPGEAIGLIQRGLWEGVPATAAAGSGAPEEKTRASSPPPLKVKSTPPVQALRRFHGTVNIGEDPIGTFSDVVQNVVEHFAAQYGTEVSVVVDIEARRPDGFDGPLVRVIRENAKTLRFMTADFEED